MQRRNYLTLVFISLFSWLTVVGCSTAGLSTLPGSGSHGARHSQTRDGVTITVSAAASLQDALDAIAPQFTAAYPDIIVDYNFASSGVLQRQIEQGAPVDIFFAAATNQMDALSDKGLIQSGSRQELVANSLVLITPITSDLTITDVSRLRAASISKVAVGEFRSVPAGQYAEQVFQNLELLDNFQPKFVFGNNVRSVLTAVDSGNVDLGIVYATDATLSKRVKILATVPENLHQPIVYPIAIVQNTNYPEAAKTFIDFLTTESAQTVFAEFGFRR